MIGMMKLSRLEREKRFLLLRELRIRKARDNFYEFCKILTPSFYTEDKRFLKDLCDTLQNIYENKLVKNDGTPYRKILLSVPPRHGKTLTKDHFILWGLGKNPLNMRVISASYGQDLSIQSSRFIRNKIMEEKNEDYQICYADIFPETRIARGNASVQKWAVEGSFFTYKATSRGGSVTGSGTNFAVIDDLIKDHTEANNEQMLENAFDWFRNTFLSREEGSGDGIFIMIGTRWATKDPIGRLLQSEYGDEWLEINLKAYDDESKMMLCENVLSKKQYDMLKNTMDRNIFLANFQQTPIDSEGRLYKTFCTYEKRPEYFEEIIAYVDTADTGADYLACIIGGIYERELYVLDVLYTNEDMTITEPILAQLLHDNQKEYEQKIRVMIEGNNGGSNFARTIERMLKTEYENNNVSIDWFHQSKNKYSRILSNASFVQKHVFFPSNWHSRFADFYNHLIAYQRNQKANKHDDSADALTGIVEMLEDDRIELSGGLWE